MTDFSLSQITLYPIKSLGGIALTASEVEARGLSYDRRWMLVDEDGRFLTQRELPQMALISSVLEASSLRLDAPGQPDLSIPLHSEGPTQNVRVWRSVCEAVAVGTEADAWFTGFLGVRCHLVYMPNATRRVVNPDFTAGEGIVSFADGYPVMLLGQASLDDLNRRLADPVPMDRFRPNFVVAGTDAYAEDGWKKVRIGSAVFHVVKPCVRCSLTTIDQATGEPCGTEPLKTLAMYRVSDQKVVFGQYLIPDGSGTVHVGDALEVLSA